jgi:serine/threonine protein kinase
VRDPSFAVLRKGALFHDRYHVVRCINVGGMGAVYEVRDERTDSHRALKVMLPEILADADMRARFALEARITGGIESDHIVHISDAGVDPESGTPFLVMDLLRGEELGSMVAARGALPPGEVVIYLSQAALALDKTHAAGIIHRDLKPENLFVTRRDDGAPCLKILDFGIAKMRKPSIVAETKRALGTPLYMAPEQVDSRALVGHKADLYAMGQIAYTLLVSKPYWYDEIREASGIARFFAKRALYLAEVTGSTWQSIIIEGDLAIIEADLGRIDAAIDRLRRLTERTVDLGMRWQTPVFSQNLSALLLRAGRSREAAEAAQRTAELAIAAGDPVFRATALSLRADALRRDGDLAAALASIDEAEQLQRERGGRSRALTLLRRAMIRYALGRVDEALEDARSARAVAERYADPNVAIGANVWEKLRLAQRGELSREDVERAVAAADDVKIRLLSREIVAEAKAFIAGA